MIHLAPKALLSSHYLKNILYAKHTQYSLGVCNFPFQVWSPWGCKIMFLVKETVPSNKRCSCPSRAQLEFFERSVTYLQRNGVIERIVTYCQTMVWLSKEAADSILFLVSKTFPSNKWCSFQTDGSWVSLKGGLHFSQKHLRCLGSRLVV